MVILVIIVAAFSCELVEKTAAIAKLEERLGAELGALRNDVDEKIEKAHTVIDKKINSTLEKLLSEREEDFGVDHQIGYR